MTQGTLDLVAKLKAYAEALMAVPLPVVSSQVAKSTLIFASGLLRKTIVYISDRTK